jgi:hypothetical protein
MSPLVPAADSMPFSEETYRSVSRDLYEWSVYGPAGVTEQSDRFKLVTEGRDPGPNYSCCADLPHWGMWRLGIRSPYLNREERTEAPGDWKSQVNIWRLYSSPDTKTEGLNVVPKCGDVWLIGSTPTNWHALVCDRLEDGNVLHSWDYGQAALKEPAWHPGSIEGCRRERGLRQVSGQWVFPDGKRLLAYINLWDALQGAQKRGELHPLYEYPEESNGTGL